MKLLIIVVFAFICLGMSLELRDLSMARMKKEINRVVHVKEDYKDQKHVVKSSDSEDDPIETTVTQASTTKQVVQVTEQPKAGNVQCDTITANYVGKFHGTWNNAEPAAKAQFQVKMKIDRTTRTVRMTSELVNKAYSPDKNVSTEFKIKDETDCYKTIWTDFMEKNEWVLPLANSSAIFEMMVDIKNSTIDLKRCHQNSIFYTIMNFHDFKDSFVLNQPVGQCTNKQIINPMLPAQELFDYCVCCGEYQSGGPLNCPVSPFSQGSDVETPKVQIETPKVQAETPHKTKVNKPKPKAQPKKNARHQPKKAVHKNSKANKRS